MEKQISYICIVMINEKKIKGFSFVQEMQRRKRLILAYSRGEITKTELEDNGIRLAMPIRR